MLFMKINPNTFQTYAYHSISCSLFFQASHLSITLFLVLQGLLGQGGSPFVLFNSSTRYNLPLYLTLPSEQVFSLHCLCTLQRQTYPAPLPFSYHHIFPLSLFHLGKSSSFFDPSCITTSTPITILSLIVHHMCSLWFRFIAIIRRLIGILFSASIPLTCLKFDVPAVHPCTFLNNPTFTHFSYVSTSCITFPHSSHNSYN